MLHLSQETHNGLHTVTHFYFFVAMKLQKLAAHGCDVSRLVALFFFFPEGNFGSPLSNLWKLVISNSVLFSTHIFFFFFTPKIKPLLWITIYDLEGIKIYW